MAPNSHMPAAPPSTESLPRDLHGALEALARLLETPVEPPAFYQAFLQTAQAALGGVAATLWTVADERFRLEYQNNFAAVSLDRIANGPACHEEILRRVVQRDRPVWAPPRQDADGSITASNRTPLGLILAPLLIESTPVGVFEVWLPPSQESDNREAAARFMTAAAGVAAAYRHRAEWRQLREQQRAWQQGDALVRQLHGSLDPRQLSHLVAHQGRVVLGCDQVGVGLQRAQRGEVVVEAVSGATVVAARSPVVEAMRTLFDRVLAWGETVVYQGRRDETLPPAVLKALDAYLALSGSRLLIVLPLRDERDDAADAGRAALLLESFGPDLDAATLEARARALASPAAAAFHNALAYQLARAGLATRTVAGLHRWVAGKRGRVFALVAGGVALIALALATVPAPLRVEARGQLLPKERQIVYATRPGKVVEVKTHHGDPVQKGQELLFQEDLDAQLKVDQLNLKVAFAEQRLAALDEQTSKTNAPEERNALLRERINQDYEMRRAVVERDLLVQDSRSPRKSPVAAPLTGRLVTFDAREQLVGKVVKPGDPLVRIARVQGPWEIELNLGEASLAPIREALKQTADGALDVSLLLTNQPLRTYAGKLRREGLGGETVVKDNQVVLPVRIDVTDPELAETLPTLPVGLEVRARIHCGTHPVGRVWFGDLLECLYDRLLF